MRPRSAFPLSCVCAALAFSCTGAPSSSRADDVRALLALHEQVMEAHRRSDVGLLLGADADDFVMANRGEITRPTTAQRRERLGAYLARTRFAEYRDLVPPVVEVSRDGSLGWVIVQVGARGVQTDDAGDEAPIEFVCAWVELYAKVDGAWRSVGNVSNFKP